MDHESPAVGSIQSGLRGVLAPVITPFDANLDPNPSLWIRHCRWLLNNGVGLAVFGTSSEANSLSVAEKRSLLDQITTAGLPTARIMSGTGCCSLTETVELTGHALQSGCGGVLILPPFYYKPVSDEGLYRYFAEVIERVADPRLRIYLYHIPSLAKVGITFSLIERLLTDYMGVIAGIKDSSGDWNNTQTLLTNFQSPGFDVFSGSEGFLLATLCGGGAGCISATANVNPAAIATLARTWNDDDAEEQQIQLNGVRTIFQEYVMIPALKAAVAHYTDEDDWNCLRPPLVGFSPAQSATLLARLNAVGFQMYR